MKDLSTFVSGFIFDIEDDGYYPAKCLELLAQQFGVASQEA
jgi:hypothetical protein